MEEGKKLSKQDRAVNALPFVALVVLAAVGLVMVLCA